MERFIVRENIRRFMAQLALCTDERQAETLKRQLAAEKEKLQGLGSRRAARNKQEAVEIEERHSALLHRIADEMLVRHHPNDDQGWPAD